MATHKHLKVHGAVMPNPVWSPGVFATASFMEEQAARTKHVCVC